jgi:hypothetical protein
MTRSLPRNRVLIAVVALAVAIGAIGYGALSSWLRAEDEKDRADEAVVAAEALCQQVEAAGYTCVKDPDSLRGEPGPAGEQGPPPSDEQVYAAVESYFSVNPVEAVEPTPSAIAAAVSNYLTENPPADGERGPGPTAEQIATAVADYLTANPPASGPPGPQGERGPPPTAEEVAAAVESYLSDHPLPMCPTGYEASAETVLTTDGPIEAVICKSTEEPEGD